MCGAVTGEGSVQITGRSIWYCILDLLKSLVPRTALGLLHRSTACCILVAVQYRSAPLPTLAAAAATTTYFLQLSTQLPYVTTTTARLELSLQL